MMMQLNRLILALYCLMIVGVGNMPGGGESPLLYEKSEWVNLIRLILKGKVYLLAFSSLK